MTQHDYRPMRGEEEERLRRRIKITSGVRILERKPDVGLHVKPYQVGVKDPGTGKYEYASFDSTDDLCAHATKTWTAFHAGTSTAGKVYVSQVRDEYLASKKSEVGAAQYKYCTYIIDQLLAFGINDLKSPTVAKRTIAMLDELCTPCPPKVVDGKRIPGRRGRGAHSRNSLVTDLRCFGAWCVASGMAVNKNPFGMVPYTEATDKLPPVYTGEECLALASDAALTTEAGRLAFLLLYTGVREREALWLRAKHFHWEARALAITAESAADLAHAKALGFYLGKDKREPRRKGVKGKRERLVPLEREFVAAFRPFVSEDPEAFVFCDRFRKDMSSRLLKKVAKAMDGLGVKRGDRDIHSLRHTYACLLNGAGVALDEIKDRLGHADIETTEKYCASRRVLAVFTESWRKAFELRKGSGTGCTPGVSPEVKPAPAVTRAEPPGLSSGYIAKYHRNKHLGMDYAEGASAWDKVECHVVTPPCRFPSWTWEFDSPRPLHILSADDVVVLDDEPLIIDLSKIKLGVR